MGGRGGGEGGRGGGRRGRPVLLYEREYHTPKYEMLWFRGGKTQLSLLSHVCVCVCVCVCATTCMFVRVKRGEGRLTRKKKKEIVLMDSLNMSRPFMSFNEYTNLLRWKMCVPAISPPMTVSFEST